jgi:hypothetical protein
MIQRDRMELHRSALADIDFGVTNSVAPRVLENDPKATLAVHFSRDAQQASFSFDPIETA